MSHTHVRNLSRPSVPTVLSLDNGDIITNPYDNANTFNNYFASIPETTKNITYS